MKVYQNLSLPLADTTVEQVIKKIDAVLPSIWLRDTKQEDYLDEKLGDDKQYGYSTVNNPDLPDARLWLAKGYEFRLYVSNIVPCESGKLTMEEYNTILKSFVKVLKYDTSIQFELTKPDMALEDILPETVAQKLKLFSNCANKSSGYSHPSDFDRWLDFVVSLHESRHEGRLELIERWLHEDAGWLWETASELSCQVEYSLDLLKYYDRNR